MDTLMTSSIDELYEMDHDLIHTRNGKGTEALQGGFLLVRLSAIHSRLTLSYRSVDSP